MPVAPGRKDSSSSQPYAVGVTKVPELSLLNVFQIVLCVG